MILLCFGGFLLGQVMGLVLSSACASLANYHGSLIKLSTSSEPPWWFIASGLVGLWIGFLSATALVQVRYRVLSIPRVFVLRATDVGYVLLGVGLQFAIGLVYSPFHVKLGGPANKILGGATGWEFAVVAIMTVVGAPIVEELFFRGTLLRGLQGLFRVFSPTVALVAAIVTDGVLFGLAHGELVQFPGLAVVGVVLAYVYVRTQRLLPSMIAHASFNAVALVAVLAQRSHS